MAKNTCQMCEEMIVLDSEMLQTCPVHCLVLDDPKVRVDERFHITCVQNVSQDWSIKPIFQKWPWWSSTLVPSGPNEAYLQKSGIVTGPPHSGNAFV